MKLVRSWPRKPPDNHPRIQDNCPRITVDWCDYSSLLQLNDDVLQLDWDVAVGLDELQAFARRCLDESERVRVGPTMSYPTRQRRWHAAPGTPKQYMVWSAESWATDRVGLKPPTPTCNYFAFGMVYLPRWTLEAFMESIPEFGPTLNDVSFSAWYQDITGGIEVPIEWDAHPVHLNFSMKDALDESGT